MFTQTTVNERFTHFLKCEKIDQKKFSETTKINDGTVSNIAIGKTKEPKASFFQAIAKHYPHVNIRWLLLGEGEIYIDKKRLITIMKEPNTDYTPRSENLAPNQLGKLLDTITRLSKLANAVPAMQEEITALRKRIEELEKNAK